jgi:hypothetical protein
LTSVYSSRIADDIITAIRKELESFKRYIQNNIKYQTVNSDQLAPGVVISSKVFQEAILGQHIKEGEITTGHVTVDFGENLSLVGNAIYTYVTDQIQTAVTNLMSEVGEILATTVTQTATDIEWAVTRSREYTVEMTGSMRTNLETIMTYMRFSEGGLDLGVLGSPFATRLSNTRLSFTQDGEQVAYISNSKLYITNAEISGSLSVGNLDNGYLEILSTPSGVGFVWREDE